MFYFKKINQTYQKILKQAQLKFWGVMIIIAIIGFLNVGNYGISWDERAEINMVDYNFNLITKNEPIPHDLKHYGVIFNLTSEVVFQIKELLINKFEHPKIIDEKINNQPSSDEILRKKIKIKHPLTFIISLFAYGAVAGMVGILVGKQYAWFGAIVLALFPRFWGHSFFNPKDIPFAAMFSLGLFFGAYLVNSYVQNDRNIKLGINPITINSLLYGILVGIVTGTRIAGFLLLFFVIFTHLIISLEKGCLSRFFSRYWLLYGLMFISWMITTTIIHPASWTNPFIWFWETVQYMSKHGRDGILFFEGQLISSQSVPWYYIPKYLAITIPFIFQIAFLLGLFSILFQYKKSTVLQKSCIIFVLLQIFFLPIIAILKQSTIYDSIRQFLFILPGISVISATGIICIYKKIKKTQIKLFYLTLTITLLSLTLRDMITLHPYEYIYFNRLSGGLEKAQTKYETDYWGLSMREGMEWINNNVDSGTQVISSYPLDSSKTFAKKDIDVILINGTEQEQIEMYKNFYYIALPRLDFQDKFADCPIIYSVERQNVQLTVVKKCDY